MEHDPAHVLEQYVIGKDYDKYQIKEIQETLEYPWVERHAAISVLKGFRNLTDITKYLINKGR